MTNDTITFCAGCLVVTSVILGTIGSLWSYNVRSIPISLTQVAAQERLAQDCLRAQGSWVPSVSATGGYNYVSNGYACILGRGKE